MLETWSELPNLRFPGAVDNDLSSCSELSSAEFEWANELKGSRALPAKAKPAVFNIDLLSIFILVYWLSV
ncbi:hypothetical protein FEM21_12970 [Flavobacterium seoulense]|uniref:Uncharacterized protein n=1 Tax=Flavobacterium seoulense TaxID=1492738 RepID=A0A066WYD9_9FLAO|nr:hypothetical protein FEM21_12970 [Flavobacterium seoulense]